MSRILMANIPAHGVANPSLPLTKALVDAGHEVDYLMPEPFRSRVELTGASVVPYAFAVAEPISAPQHLLRRGRLLFTEMTAAMVRLGPRYDAVIAGGIQPAFPDVQRRLDCPVIFFPPVFLQNDRTMRHFADIITGLPPRVRRVMGTPALRRGLGSVLPLVFGTSVGDPVRLLGPQSETLNLVNTSRYHQPFDEDFTENCLWIGPTPTISAAADSFPLDRLREHPGPVVYATLGTVFNSWTPFFRTVAEAFAGTDTLVVMTTGNEANRAKIGPVPENVILRAFVPQADVLREADVCFTHGGFGSATDCVSLGVPPILTPMGADQFFNAYRLQELEAGTVLPKAEFSPEAVRRRAEQALSGSGSYGGMAALHDSFETAGGPEVGVRAIEDLLR